MAFGPDSIKTTPNVTYDLILFVVKNIDSDQIHGDVTVQTLDQSGRVGRQSFLWCHRHKTSSNFGFKNMKFWKIKKLRKVFSSYNLKKSGWQTANAWQRSSTRLKGTYVFLPLLACIVLQDTSLLVNTVADTRWQSGFCKCLTVAYKNACLSTKSY